MHPTWGAYAYWLGLQIDSASTTSIWGRWVLGYNWTHGPDSGSLEGGIAPTFLILRLTQDAPWSSCLGMQIYVPIEQNGAWGPATIYGDQGCVPDPVPFTFVVDNFIGMFP
jgi:hypothetical protein